MAVPPEPRVLRANNPGPFTLDGTRTYLVGREKVAVIDPGPDVEDHVRAVASAVEGAREVVLVLTHGHGDHAGAAASLAGLLGAAVYGHPSIPEVTVPLEEGGTVETDAGTLVGVPTPGHSLDHLCLHWAEAGALFVGDLLLGVGDTTWVGAYQGCVADYMRSLRRLRSLDVRIMYPGHGPPITDPETALERYEAHRRGRIEEVRRALEAEPDAGAERLLEVVYGTELPEGVRRAALRSVEALAWHVRSGGG